MGNSGGLFNSIFQLYQTEEVGRDQSLRKVVFQKLPLLLGAPQEMPRNGQWQCPALIQSMIVAARVMAMALKPQKKGCHSSSDQNSPVQF